MDGCTYSYIYIVCCGPAHQLRVGGVDRRPLLAAAIFLVRVTILIYLPDNCKVDNSKIDKKTTVLTHLKLMIIENDSTSPHCLSFLTRPSSTSWLFNHWCLPHTFRYSLSLPMPIRHRRVSCRSLDLIDSITGPKLVKKSGPFLRGIDSSCGPGIFSSVQEDCIVHISWNSCSWLRRSLLADSTLSGVMG